eukprot:gene17019-23308_t
MHYAAGKAQVAMVGTAVLFGLCLIAPPQAHASIAKAQEAVVATPPTTTARRLGHQFRNTIRANPKAATIASCVLCVMLIVQVARAATTAGALQKSQKKLTETEAKLAEVEAVSISILKAMETQLAPDERASHGALKISRGSSGKGSQIQGFSSSCQGSNKLAKVMAHSKSEDEAAAKEAKFEASAAAIKAATSSPQSVAAGELRHSPEAAIAAALDAVAAAKDAVAAAKNALSSHVAKTKNAVKAAKNALPSDVGASGDASASGHASGSGDASVPNGGAGSTRTNVPRDARSLTDFK